MATDAPNRSLSAAQKWAIAGCVLILVWSVPGLIANPDFGVGAGTSTKVVLGVDMNGWHAVSGFLIVIPIVLAFRNAELLTWVLFAAAAGVYGTALWTLLSERPAAGLFFFPHPTGDIVLHLVMGSIFLAGAVAGHRGSAQLTAAG